MTVVVAFVTADAALMAADTEATEEDGSRHETEKIWPCGSLVVGYTGTGIIQQPLRRALDQVIPAAEQQGHLDRWTIRQHICQVTSVVLSNEYALRAPATAGQVPAELAGVLLAIGRDAEGFWLLEVGKHAGGSFYDEAGFHTVGSGALAAQMARGLLRNYEPVGRSLPHLRLIAYRTVVTCIGVLGSGYGVGGHVDLWEAEGNQSFAKRDEVGLRGVANGVDQWMTIEAESIDQVVTEEPDAEGVVMPEGLEDDPHAAQLAEPPPVEDELARE